MMEFFLWLELEEALLQPESTSAVPLIAVAVNDLMKSRLEVGVMSVIVDLHIVK
jgi:hypothetical protein